MADLKTLPQELSDRLQNLADSERAAIISFVAPQDAVRISPVTFVSAEIEEKEMYRLEEMVEKIVSEKGVFPKLHLIIQTPGGGLQASYKIARFLRSKFTNIKAFVPYQAVSGGTILCCAANELYIGELGNLTPIDLQILYKNIWTSAYSFIRAVDSIKQNYGERSPGEVPTPWQQMAAKLDPIVYDEMNALVFTTMIYADNLLEQSGYSMQDAIGLAANLTKTIYTHDYPIFSKEAREMGFHVKTNNATMKTYRELVSVRLKEKIPNHCIEHFVPRIPLVKTELPKQSIPELTHREERKKSPTQ